MSYLIPTYILARVPISPTPADGICNTSGYAINGTYNDYQYLSTGEDHITPDFTLTFCLGSKVGPLEPGLHTVTSSGIQ